MLHVYRLAELVNAKGTNSVLYIAGISSELLLSFLSEAVMPTHSVCAYSAQLCSNYIHCRCIHNILHTL